VYHFKYGEIKMDINERDYLWRWLLMETLQDNRPYIWFGWEGIVPLVYYPR
jgi:hypothetical protein